MLCFFLPLFLFFCFSYGLSPKEKSNCWVVPLNLEKIVFSFFRHTLKKNNPLPAFGIDNFHKKMPIPRAGPEINFKLLSLKTGLVQREVALFLWTPGFFKGKKLAKKKNKYQFPAFCETELFQKGKGSFRDRTSKMASLFQENLLLRKKVDYQEVFSWEGQKINCSSKQGLRRQVQLIHTKKIFLWIENWAFSKQSSPLFFKTGLFQEEKYLVQKNLRYEQTVSP